MGARVLVVGGGVMGLSIAWRLSQQGASVTVLERSIPGAEASSAAAGILAPQMESEGPGPFLELCLRSRGLYPRFAEELREVSGVDVQYLPCGVLEVAFDDDRATTLEAHAAWQLAHGLRAEVLSGAEASTLEPALSNKARLAVRFPDDHQVDNRLLVKALSMAAARAGVTFRTGYVQGISESGGKATGVQLDGALVEADAVVVAAGSWSGVVPNAKLSPQAVRPARGQMMQLELRLPLFRHILASGRGYLVPRQDGRVIAGSTMEHVGFEKRVTADGLAKILGMALELCPALGAAPVSETWAGLRPYTEDRLPLLGRGALDRLFVATGHFRNGILLAPITAKVISELVLGQTPGVDLRAFRPDRYG